MSVAYPTHPDQAVAAMDAAVAGLLEPRDAAGHKDLPGWEPFMGPRYGLPGLREPLSVFRGEGVALWAIARELRPAVILDLYTGTGYAACWLALGAPRAQVYSVDNYLEGGAGDRGWNAAHELAGRLKLWNLRLIRGEPAELALALTLRDGAGGRGAEPGLVFLDGHNAAWPAPAGAVVAVHDCVEAVPDRQEVFSILGGSHLKVGCPDAETRARLADAVARTVVEAGPAPTTAAAIVRRS